jgi:DNA-binding LytR/AlgR family response regulator
MKKYRCIIVDDEQLARELIQVHLAQLDDFEIVASCASAIEAYKVLETESVDLLLLDIEMPVLKGTDFYNSLVHKPAVIFTTAYRDYAVEGFELSAVDYLLKPIVFSRFFKAIGKFKLQVEPLSGNKKTNLKKEPLIVEYIFIRENRKQIKLLFNTILYVQGLKDYIKIFLDDGSHIIKSTLSNFEKQLPNDFLRVHRSYIVNKLKISAYTNHDIEMGDNEIPIGENYKNIVISEFNKDWRNN